MSNRNKREKEILARVYREFINGKRITIYEAYKTPSPAKVKIYERIRDKFGKHMGILTHNTNFITLWAYDFKTSTFYYIAPTLTIKAPYDECREYFNSVYKNK